MGAINTHNIKKLHIDEEVYIIGSGHSMDFFSQKFFEGKFVIALNNMWKFFPCRYMLTHHHEIAQDAINNGIRVMVSEYNLSHDINQKHDLDGIYWYYEHNPQGYCSVNLDDFGKKVCSAGTPVVAAMQVAYMIGARQIFLCGVDGGEIDGKLNYSKYPIPTQNGHPGRVQGVINQVADKIRENGVGVYYILPFTNLTLDGHKFNGSSPSWG